MKVKLLRYILGFAVGFTIFAVIIPTGIYYLSLAIDNLLEIERFGTPAVRFILAAPFIVVGILFVIWSNINLVIRGRGGPADGFGVAVSPRTERLVVAGPYRYTRNPMVLGAHLSYIAIALFMGSLGGLLILAVLIILSIIYLKIVEEARLVADFGEEYEEYRREVSMIVPLPRKISK
jgi:protein-S-isoprenylcysteine O-methyltransferase Ste14